MSGEQADCSEPYNFNCSKFFNPYTGSEKSAGSIKLPMYPANHRGALLSKLTKMIFWYHLFVFNNKIFKKRNIVLRILKKVTQNRKKSVISSYVTTAVNNVIGNINCIVQNKNRIGRKIRIKVCSCLFKITPSLLSRYIREIHEGKAVECGLVLAGIMGDRVSTSGKRGRWVRTVRVYTPLFQRATYSTKISYSRCSRSTPFSDFLYISQVNNLFFVAVLWRVLVYRNLVKTHTVFRIYYRAIAESSKVQTSSVLCWVSTVLFFFAGLFSVFAYWNSVKNHTVYLIYLIYCHVIRESLKVHEFIVHRWVVTGLSNFRR